MTEISTQARRIPTHILLAHSDAVARRTLHLVLAASGYQVKAYALEGAVSRDPGISEGSCLIAEHRRPHMDGIALLLDLRARLWRRPAILLAAERSDDLKAEANAAGYAHVLQQPFAHHVLLGMVDSLVAVG
ncbi:response regulator [Sphingobium nicotianae]|uniref:Response regulator n=1 Tax=Sphingobium nicotianae TaxID=2782607 RepID=A0A9X1DDT2_9SPHN|nr:response regulator [Sphingobium nicotianae]MBT2188342.1 response regulator [Sphingobium nicotianae]